MGENLNREEKSVIQNLVEEYVDIFAVNTKCPKQSKLVEHQIITEDRGHQCK